MNAHDSMAAYVTHRAPELAPRRHTPRTVTVRLTRAPRRTWSAWHLVAVAIVGALIGLWISPGRAHGVQLEPADRNVDTVRVSYVEPVGARKLYVELNNGAAYRLNPCRHEDGRQCYWDAGDRGNGAGSSFVRVSGRLIYSSMIGGAR